MLFISTVADGKHARGNQHRAALVFVAGVDGGLQRRRIEGDAVAFGSEIADVVGLGAEVVSGPRLRLCIGDGQQTGRRRRSTQPRAPGEMFIVKVTHSWTIG